MTDQRCDLPGGYVDDWRAGEIVCEALHKDSPDWKPRFRAGNGFGHTAVTVAAYGHQAERAAIIANEALRPYGLCVSVGPDQRGEALTIIDPSEG